MKTWDLAKKSHFASVLATEAVNANFLHTMMIHIENGAHGEILNFSVVWIFKFPHGTTVKTCHDRYEEFPKYMEVPTTLHTRYRKSSHSTVKREHFFGKPYYENTL